MTVALTVLALPMAPVMHVNWVALVTLTEPQFMPPIETVAPDANPVPVRVYVTHVPLLTDGGSMEVIVGAEAAVMGNVTPLDNWPSEFFTLTV